MIHNKQRVLANPRLCQALFGVSRTEIEALLPVFSQCLLAYQHAVKPDRKRRIGGGRRGDLPTAEDKLLYALMYLKVYPTYDVLSVLADHQRSKCGDSIQRFLPILESALGRKLVLPERKATSLEEVFERVPGLKDVFLDGTERRVQRPRDKKKRNKLYSGKKKGTTRKTIIINDDKKRILFMTPTKSGRRHDKRVTDKYGVGAAIPKEVTLWTDTGFQGIHQTHENTIMPTKATKNKPLTLEQKQNNRIISGIRVVSEHAIGGLKRFKAAADIYRNKLPNLDDTFMLLAAGLWNFHLEQTR